ncbi:mannoprotein, variant 2 [Clonorchis sinensis]|nr:mannoprotein, variant 2 [Clonorchis sinensis]
MDILQLRLVGPFEVLHLGISSSVEPGQYVRCYRYFHDPPELVTLLTGPNNLHYGYIRDTPTEKPTVVVKTEPSNGGEINLVAPTLFAAMKSLLSKKPTASAQVLLKKLCTFAKQNNIILDATGHEKSERRARCVCPTLNGMGLVVKLREGDIGYRPLSVSDSKLSALLKAVATAQTEESQLAKLEAVDQLITYAQFACDEGDYGQSLELGLSLLAFRAKDIKPNQVTVFNSRIKHLLSVGYELAGRPEFSHVVREHMTDRRVDPIGMPWNSE